MFFLLRRGFLTQNNREITIGFLFSLPILPFLLSFSFEYIIAGLFVFSVKEFGP